MAASGGTWSKGSFKPAGGSPRRQNVSAMPVTTRQVGVRTVYQAGGRSFFTRREAQQYARSGNAQRPAEMRREPNRGDTMEMRGGYSFPIGTSTYLVRG